MRKKPGVALDNIPQHNKSLDASGISELLSDNLSVTWLTALTPTFDGFALNQISTSMHERYLYTFLLMILLAFSQLALAQESQQPKSRDVLVKESIANLDSNDIHVAAQAAIDLGYLRATEAVPAMLRVLKSSRLLSTTEHMPKDKDGM